MVEPQDCPFCGWKDVDDTVYHIGLTFICAVECKECGLEGPTGDHVRQHVDGAKKRAKRTAIKNWNQLTTKS